MHLQQAVRRHKDQVDRLLVKPQQYQPRQKLWLLTRDIRLHLTCSPLYIGPFTVQRQLNEVTYKLDFPSQYRISPYFHVSLLKPYIKPVTSPPTETVPEDVPPPSVPVEQEPIYRVCTIMDSWRRGLRLEYLVDWENYGPEEWSWVPRDDILDPDFSRLSTIQRSW